MLIGRITNISNIDRWFISIIFSIKNIPMLISQKANFSFKFLNDIKYANLA